MIFVILLKQLHELYYFLLLDQLQLQIMHSLDSVFSVVSSYVLYFYSLIDVNFDIFPTKWNVIYSLSPALRFQGCSLRNTEYIIGAVIFAGHETKVCHLLVQYDRIYDYFSLLITPSSCLHVKLTCIIMTGVFCFRGSDTFCKCCEIKEPLL